MGWGDFGRVVAVIIVDELQELVEPHLAVIGLELCLCFECYE